MIQADIDKVMAEFPDLASCGFMYPGDRSAWDWALRDCKDAQMEKDTRRETLAHSDTRLLSCIENLLDGVGKTKSGFGGHSYGLKHAIENKLGTYITNGQLILVALHLDFEHRVDGPNALFNMSSRDLRLLDAIEDKPRFTNSWKN